jgi:phthalate 4,5-dioxygenase oxygenase subunit
MLSTEETELLCRVGPGTPMGALMRQYWLPVLYEWEITPGSQPLRVRLMGEDLLAWRSQSGTPVFTQERCPHRGASMYYGRVDGEGLRCAYHGWLFDVDGRCAEMPNERAESDFKRKVRVASYRGAEAGGLVWAYMGPRQDDPPPLPAHEFTLVPSDQRRHYRKAVYECNWMQALEGELDSTHVYFLHARLNKADSPEYGLYHPDQTALFHLRDTYAGLTYAAERAEPGGDTYWRTTHYLFPFYGMFPGDAAKVPLSLYVPIDDEHTLHMGIEWNPSTPVPEPRWPAPTLPAETGLIVEGMGPMLPEQHGRFFSHWWPEANPRTDFLMDPVAKSTKNFTGIPSVRLQDAAVIWSMGPIMDRTAEHLCTTDAAIIRVRRKLIAAAKALAATGQTPPGVDNPEVYTVRSANVALPPEADWEATLGDWHHARSADYPTREKARR